MEEKPTLKVGRVFVWIPDCIKRKRSQQSPSTQGFLLPDYGHNLTTAPQAYHHNCILELPVNINPSLIKLLLSIFIDHKSKAFIHSFIDSMYIEPEASPAPVEGPKPMHTLAILVDWGEFIKIKAHGWDSSSLKARTVLQFGSQQPHQIAHNCL